MPSIIETRGDDSPPDTGNMRILVRKEEPMSELDKTIGANIRLYRRANHITLEELAGRIHKSKATLGKYEQGTISMDINTLWEIAAALQIEPEQLLKNLHPNKETEMTGGDPAVGRQYLYVYDGRAKRIMRSLLAGGVSQEENPPLTLFYDVPDFDQLHRCRTLYYGRRQRQDMVINYYFKNQSNGVERVTITLMRSLEMESRGTGLMTGLSARRLLPVSMKCILSSEILEENDTLVQSLLLTKEDMQLTRKNNMFMVEM